MCVEIDLFLLSLPRSNFDWLKWNQVSCLCVINFYLPTWLELNFPFLFSPRSSSTTIRLNVDLWQSSPSLLSLLGNQCLRREICFFCWHCLNAQSCMRASIMQVVVIAAKVIRASRHQRRSNLKTDRTTVISHVSFSRCACPPTYWISFFSSTTSFCPIRISRPSPARHLCSYQIIWICIQARSKEIGIIYVHSFPALTQVHLMCLRRRERRQPIKRRNISIVHSLSLFLLRGVDLRMIERSTYRVPSDRFACWHRGSVPFWTIQIRRRYARLKQHYTCTTNAFISTSVYLEETSFHRYRYLSLQRCLQREYQPWANLKQSEVSIWKGGKGNWVRILFILRQDIRCNYWRWG